MRPVVLVTVTAFGEFEIYRIEDAETGEWVDKGKRLDFLKQRSRRRGEKSVGKDNQT